MQQSSDDLKEWSVRLQRVRDRWDQFSLQAEETRCVLLQSITLPHDGTIAEWLVRTADQETSRYDWGRSLGRTKRRPGMSRRTRVTPWAAALKRLIRESSQLICDLPESRARTYWSRWPTVPQFKVNNHVWIDLLFEQGWKSGHIDRHVQVERNGVVGRYRILSNDLLPKTSDIEVLELMGQRTVDPNGIENCGGYIAEFVSEIEDIVSASQLLLNELAENIAVPVSLPGPVPVPASVEQSLIEECREKSGQLRALYLDALKRTDQTQEAGIREFYRQYKHLCQAMRSVFSTVSSQCIFANQTLDGDARELTEHLWKKQPASDVPEAHFRPASGGNATFLGHESETLPDAIRGAAEQTIQLLQKCSLFPNSDLGSSELREDEPTCWFDHDGVQKFRDSIRQVATDEFWAQHGCRFGEEGTTAGSSPADGAGQKESGAGAGKEVDGDEDVELAALWIEDPLVAVETLLNFEQDYQSALKTKSVGRPPKTLVVSPAGPDHRIRCLTLARAYRLSSAERPEVFATASAEVAAYFDAVRCGDFEKGGEIAGPFIDALVTIRKSLQLKNALASGNSSEKGTAARQVQTSVSKSREPREDGDSNRDPNRKWLNSYAFWAALKKIHFEESKQGVVLKNVNPVPNTQIKKMGVAGNVSDFMRNNLIALIKDDQAKPRELYAEFCRYAGRNPQEAFEYVVQKISESDGKRNWREKNASEVALDGRDQNWRERQEQIDREIDSESN
ncbi:MAG: hypothetical protein Fues2KO_50560 [Fuerstiella sp.]